VLRQFSGASIRRVIDRSYTCVPEHAHDWPVLSLYVLGAYRNTTEIGETFIAGPSAVLYRRGAAHRNLTAAAGFEQIEIEFDPAWIGGDCLPGVPVSRWVGGPTAARSLALGRKCGEISAAELRAALRTLLQGAGRARQVHAPQWVAALTRRLRADTGLRVSQLAREVGRCPSWTGSAYRQATGESWQESAARIRVERATCLLRESDAAMASIAIEAGFCDQSHMSRTFARVLGRTPGVVRRERQGFRNEDA
jgi:AraC family transcriptional regulator